MRFLALKTVEQEELMPGSSRSGLPGKGLRAPRKPLPAQWTPPDAPPPNRRPPRTPPLPQSPPPPVPGEGRTLSTLRSIGGVSIAGRKRPHPNRPRGYTPQVVDLPWPRNRAPGTGLATPRHGVPRATARRSLENERTRPGPEAGVARLLEEPGFRGDRDPHARARQRRQHGHLHAARPGDAARAARRAARPAGRALRSRPVLGLVQQTGATR